MMGDFFKMLNYQDGETMGILISGEGIPQQAVWARTGKILPNLSCAKTQGQDGQHERQVGIEP